MADSSNDTLLEKYIFKLMELKANRVETLTPEDLHQIALDLGLSTDDLTFFTQEAENHKKRGLSYISAKRLEEAQQELDKALTINPLNADYKYQMANIYLLKWKQEKGKQNLKMAENWAKQCLDLQPSHQLAVEILKQIDSFTTKAKFKRRIFISISAVIFIFLAGASLFVMNETGFFDPPPTGFEGKEYPILTEWIPSEQAEGVHFTIQEANIKHSSYKYEQNSFHFNFLGDLTSEKYEIKNIQINADFLAKGDSVVAHQFYNLIYENGFSLRPNDILMVNQKDHWAISFITSKPTYIQKVKLSVKSIERFAPPPSYPKGDILDIQWLSKKPDYLDFEIEARENKVEIGNEIDQNTNHKLLLAIKNNGTHLCRDLVLDLAWIGADGKEIDTNEVRLINLKGRELKIGETIVYEHFRWFYPPVPFPKPFEKVIVKIKTAE
jgi:tetratricopeptide (TPR) repeat protein